LEKTSETVAAVILNCWKELRRTPSLGFSVYLF